MKKMFVLMMLILMFSVTAMAQSLPIAVQGGYFLGDASTEVMGVTMAKEDANGFWGTVEAAISESFGAVGNFYSVDGNTFDGSRFDILGSFAIPGAEDYNLKALAGYSITSLEYIGVTAKAKGLFVGAQGETSPMDKVTIAGFLGFGLGMKFDANSIEYGKFTGDCGLVSMNFSGSYELSDTMSLIAGYRSEKYSPKIFPGVDSFAKITGFYFGAKAVF